MNKWVIAAGAAAVLIGAAVVGANRYADGRGERELETVLRLAVPQGTVTHGPVHYSLFSDRLDVDDVAAAPDGQPWKSIHARHLTVSGALRPVIDSVTASGVDLETPSGDHQTLDEIAALGVDPAAVAQLASPTARGAADATLYAPVASLALTGVKLGNGDISIAADRAVLLAPKLPRPTVGADGAVAPADVRTLLAAMAVEKAELAGVQAHGPGGAKGGITLGRLAAEKIAPGHVGTLALESLAIEASDGSRLKLGSLEISGGAYRPYSAKARASAAMLSLPVSEWMPGHVFFDRFALDNLVVSPTDGGEVGLKSIRATMAGSLAEATAFDLTLQELAVDLTKLPPSHYGFDPTEFGLDRFVLNIDVQSRYDPAAHTVEIPRYTFAMPELATLNLALSLDNFSIDPQADDPVLAMQRLLAASLRRFELRYDDQSLVTRLLTLSAKRNGSDLDTFRAGLVAQLEQVKEAQQNPAAVQVLDPVIAFLKDPHSLTVVLEPPKPVPLTTLARISTMDPNEVPKLIGLSVR